MAVSDNTKSIKTSAEHPQVATGKVGILLINLGTPDHCDTASVRRYLAEFLSDRRVIELTPILWKPILYGLILTTRPAKVVKAYDKIWKHESDESPLRFYTRRQAELLQQHFDDNTIDVTVAWGMRYGNPSQDKAFRQLQEQGCDRILVAPLYPQYSATTTASVNDAIMKTQASLRWQPTTRNLAPYFDHPDYIDALASTVGNYLSAAEQKPDVILASFHGLPQQNLEAGDPYYCHCVKTARLLREKLGMDENYLQMSFQSRFGPKQWLQPYTVTALEKLARDGKKRVAVITPGFAADCLETLEEMAIQNRDVFIQHGGTHYDLIECLNDSETGMNMLAKLVTRELQGWINSPTSR